jgi:Peptidase family S41/N-terminal domain of Peptidase_S41 in eukaryotic IRBP
MESLMTTRHRTLAIAPSLLATAALLLAGPASPAFGQAPTAPSLSAAERTAALKAITAVLEESYVFPDVRPKLVERLRRSEEAGRYEVDDPRAFADRVTEDLRDVAHDRHLSIQFAPAEYAAATADSGTDQGSEELERRQAQRDHYGLAELKILPGNIRYLRITGFEWVRDETGAAYDDAMRFLKDGDAIIIDLRGNGGGSAAAVQYLTSHFLPADTLLLTFLHDSAAPAQSRTLNYLPAGRLQGKPLFVLIDGGVASAAEEFAYHVQQFKLGELIGATTAGAANNNKFVPVAPGFMLSVSFGRPVHAVSKTNWEGVGIKPSVETPPVQALDVAESLALTRLAQAPGITPEQLADYTWARTGVEARLRPVSIPPKQLRALAGAYGDVNVTFRDGALWLTRPSRPTRRLVPMNVEGLFAVEGADVLRVRFQPKRLELLWWDETAPRVFEKS